MLMHMTGYQVATVLKSETTWSCVGLTTVFFYVGPWVKWKTFQRCYEVAMLVDKHGKPFTVKEKISGGTVGPWACSYYQIWPSLKKSGHPWCRRKEPTLPLKVCNNLVTSEVKTKVYNRCLMKMRCSSGTYLVRINHYVFYYCYLQSSEPINEAPILEIVQSHSSSAGSHVGTSSGPQKRKYGVAFLESSTANCTSQDPPPLLYSSKKPFLADQSHHASAMYPSEGLSQNPHAGPGHSRLLDPSAHHMMGLGSSSSHHSGTIFPPSHFPSGGAPQQSMYEGRKVLMCSLNNCCCSRAPAARARPPYPASDSFPSMTSQEFPPHAALPASQPLQHFPMRGLMEASQTARHPDFYGLYGQSSTKHYGTK